MLNTSKGPSSNALGMNLPLKLNVLILELDTLAGKGWPVLTRFFLDSFLNTGLNVHMQPSGLMSSFAGRPHRGPPASTGPLLHSCFLPSPRGGISMATTAIEMQAPTLRCLTFSLQRGA